MLREPQTICDTINKHLIDVHEQLIVDDTGGAVAAAAATGGTEELINTGNLLNAPQRSFFVALSITKNEKLSSRQRGLDIYLTSILSGQLHVDDICARVLDLIARVAKTGCLQDLSPCCINPSFLKAWNMAMLLGDHTKITMQLYVVSFDYWGLCFAMNSKKATGSSGAGLQSSTNRT
ncbi:hypothetical protein J6590_025553 [Homalodisca vitripennis]|nr:hypothetical protein J6590_025553 [Homalodisca vitripennis]